MLSPFVLAHWLFPECRSSSLLAEATGVVCGKCSSRFSLLRGVPVMLRRDNPVFEVAQYAGETRGRRSRWLALMGHLVPSLSVNLATTLNLRRFVEIVSANGPAHILVVGSGSQRPVLEKRFREFPGIEFVYTDVDRNADVDLFCDAHEICFAGGSFQGVIATAVLEHVYDPEVAVSELHRVLAAGGLMYSEVPFMQQVHEGAYDFTRYTLSGHRRVFSQFREIGSGVVAGPATALAWAVEGFAVCFAPGARSKQLVRGAVRLTLGWLSLLDYFWRRSPAAEDGASCTYFLGLKDPGYRRTAQDIIASYSGGRPVQHL
jgi:SAM-dependent methyltransferase